ncbi:MULTISPECIES: AtpZ/AtpI family protein [unclassified Anabaena]|uniref:AtpZ/AtpI family protein n=1 Tax=unclassified Anabaena TaxID=2619674 RepID=UPI000836DC10|nr:MULTISPECIES: AtpZ/AtpI family protein [unclassified Anabaena]
MKRSDKSTPNPPPQSDFPRQVKIKSSRKLKARREEDRSIWFSFGMIGVVGWSVAIPMLLGIALGIWIDSRWPSRYSWTLMMLFVGIVLGCLNAWYWVQQESRDD